MAFVGTRNILPLTAPFVQNYCDRHGIERVRIPHLTRGCAGVRGRQEFGRKINESIAGAQANNSAPGNAHAVLGQHDEASNDDSPKLVFLFIARDNLIRKQLWEAYFKQVDPERYECFLYAIGVLGLRI